MSQVCAICETEIADGEPHIKIEITHEENYWTAVAEPTVLAHVDCQDEMNLTFTSATTEDIDE